MLTQQKMEYTNIEGAHIRVKGDDANRVWIKTNSGAYGTLVATFKEARAIHAELTELFKLLDEK